MGRSHIQILRDLYEAQAPGSEWMLPWAGSSCWAREPFGCWTVISSGGCGAGVWGQCQGGGGEEPEVIAYQ